MSRERWNRTSLSPIMSRVHAPCLAAHDASRRPSAPTLNNGVCSVYGLRSPAAVGFPFIAYHSSQWTTKFSCVRRHIALTCFRLLFTMQYPVLRRSTVLQAHATNRSPPAVETLTRLPTSRQPQAAAMRSITGLLSHPAPDRPRASSPAHHYGCLHPLQAPQLDPLHLVAGFRLPLVADQVLLLTGLAACV